MLITEGGRGPPRVLQDKRRRASQAGAVDLRWLPSALAGFDWHTSANWKPRFFRGIQIRPD